MMEYYLGDGLYATFDGYQIWLRTDRGPRGVHEVAIDPEVWNALIEWVNRDVLTEKGPDGKRSRIVYEKVEDDGA